MSTNNWVKESSSGFDGFRNSETGEWIYSKFEPVIRYIDVFGGFNDMPKPFKEISVNRYIHKRSQYTPKLFESRYVCNGENPIGRVNIEFFDCFGLATKLPDKWTLINNEIVYTEPIRYFLLGCDHKLKEIGYQDCKKRGIYHSGRCFHVYECEICGHIESHDSSD